MAASSTLNISKNPGARENDKSRFFENFLQEYPKLNYAKL